MLRGVFALHKPLGPTSYQCLCALRDEDPSLRSQRLGHAGRLDPLAEGVLAVLVGDETRDVAAHRAASKTYEVEVLFGVATDSFDSLGLVTSSPGAAVSEAAAREAAARWVGEVTQTLPPFSQAKVDGRSLIAWGHAGVEVPRPSRVRAIHAIAVQPPRPRALADIAREAEARVALVRGDFRQERIAARWRALQTDGASLTSVTLTVDCGAGTYMRALASDLGAAVGAPAMAWRIRRTRVGDLTLTGARTLRGA
jgi:tRNA pseudouridine55 synthase